MSVLLFFCLFPNYSETAEQIEMKFYGKIPLDMQTVVGRKKIRTAEKTAWAMAPKHLRHLSKAIFFVRPLLNSQDNRVCSVVVECAIVEGKVLGSSPGWRRYRTQIVYELRIKLKTKQENQGN